MEEGLTIPCEDATNKTRTVTTRLRSTLLDPETNGCYSGQR
uniref:Uncharacterized protein n=1 Tax=Romanomermis culicivorax TaxID=13658 RepID=A0A915IW68_ROMCU